ncbi:MAG: arginine N-succinyltransferase [Gammaproteobacteria bacterium]|nr:arginine N-succinyltransferase [Gammaproteobacteria bacterium]
MKIIRPIQTQDLDALLHMAKTAGAGFTSLPPVPEFLQKKIELSEESFAAGVHKAGHERYMFVLQDVESGDVGGCCAVEAACGLDEPFYNYHVGTTVHASRELKVYNLVPTLYLSNDLTGTSVLCSLYLRPDFRGGGAGHLLSKSRFMFIANFPQRFSQKVIAEMRGVSDETGRSAFWEGLGRLFFSIDYDRAEHLVGMGNKAFIAELMPKHPIYANLLPPEARAVMGQVHVQTRPALQLLEQEGFRYQGYLDIFDGGPTVEAPQAEIRSVKRSRVVEAHLGQARRGTPHLVANTRLREFRCGLADLAPTASAVDLPAQLAQALEVKAGDPVRVVALDANARTKP